MAASGFAGLGYQIVWTQQGALWLGHEAVAVLAVIAAFFGGLALGSLALGPRIERSGHPARWYAAAEFAIGLWSLALLRLLEPASHWLLGLSGTEPSPFRHWGIAFGGTFLLLLPATAAMGATLPAMERLTAGMHSEGRSIAALYAANTFGAVLVVLASGFWLVPNLGLSRTAAVCIALNLLCAAGALAVVPRHHAAAPVQDRTTATGRRSALVRLGVTGFLGIGYEVLVVRVLSQVCEDTVYTYALLLAVYLVGTALGAAAYERWMARSVAPERLGDRLLAALSAACLIGTAGLWAAERIKDGVLDWLGPGLASALGAEAILAAATFALPTFAMGALFSHLAAQAHRQGASFGRSLGVNTLGAAAAPFAAGVLMAPAFGPKFALLAVGAAYLGLTRRSAWRSPWVVAPAGLALLLAAAGPPLRFLEIPEGGQVVSYRDGMMAAVSVVEDAAGVKRLRINNRQQEGSSATLMVDGRQALLPVLLHPAPRRALFLGLGTGMTAYSAASDSSLEVDAVELLPEVIEASRHFTAVFAEGAVEPRPRLIAADARRYVRASPAAYDVIVSDNFHPARSGSGALYTAEHFRAVRDRLAAGGLFCQWLPLHQLDLETLRSIVQSFVAAFPGGWAMLASNSLETPVLGLAGRSDASRFDPEELRARLAGSNFPEPLAAFCIDDEFALLRSFVAGPDALARFAGNAPTNTDDRPVVAYKAPRVTYAPDSLPRERLFALLEEVSIAPEEVLAISAAGGDWARRLDAYWAARNRFLSAGQGVRPATDVHAMLAQVREPLLAVLRLSPDFRPAYDPLLRMATALAVSNLSGARELLGELARIQPARPEAGLALSRLGEAGAEAP